MFQFYFLSVFFTALSGLVLCTDFIVEKFTGFHSLSEILSSSKVKFTIGLSTFIIGVLKLFIVVNGWIILGDLLPALAGMLLGFALLIDFLKERAVINTDTLMRIDNLVSANKTIIGVAGIAVAFIHFFFCGAFLL